MTLVVLPTSIGHPSQSISPLVQVVRIEARRSFRMHVFEVSLFLHLCEMTPSKSSLTLLILGLAGALTGLAFKLNHLMGAETLFNAGIVALVAGLLLWGLRVMRSK